MLSLKCIVCFVNEVPAEKEPRMYIIELSGNLQLNCSSDKPVTWIFESTVRSNSDLIFEVISKTTPSVIIKNVDYFNSGRYYCHGIISDGQNFLNELSVTVYGMTIILLLYPLHNGKKIQAVYFNNKLLL